ncbi:MAG: DUF2207 domain-containing protein [Microbacteriaceae bacterium]
MFSRVLSVTILTVLALFGLASPAAANTSDFTFESFDADYTLTRTADGAASLTVVETIVAVFPQYDQNRGILRALPQYYHERFTDPTVISVTDENGDDIYVDQLDEGPFLVLALGSDEFVRGPTTYVITYELTNVIGSFSDTGVDEFYWDVNGTGWDQPFGRVSATLHVRDDLTAALTGDTSCYVGTTQSTQTCSIDNTLEGGAMTFTATERNLGPRENLTIVVAFESGTFELGEIVDVPDDPYYEEPPVPPGPASLISNLLSGAGVFAGLGVFIAAIVSRVRRGGDARINRAVIPQYSVPKDLNVMVAAHLLERPSTAIPAQLVSLAVRKNIRILDYPVTASGAEYTLQYLSNEGVDALEQRLLRAIFGKSPVAGDVRELAPGDAKLGSGVIATSAAARVQVTTSGLRASISPRPAIFVALGVAVAVGGFMLVIANDSSNTVSLWPGLMIVMGIFAVIGSAATFRTTGALTAAGAETHNYLLGMRMYLELAEKDRFRMLQSPTGAERVDIGDTKQIIKLYEKLLPFAVIWGVEDQWMHELAVHAQTEPSDSSWFVSNNGFASFQLSQSLRSMATATTYTPPAAQTSAWTGSGNSPWGGGGSSSSSFGSSFGGSSGGGFSGGGGGGGGGGGR